MPAKRFVRRSVRTSHNAKQHAREPHDWLERSARPCDGGPGPIQQERRSACAVFAGWASSTSRRAFKAKLARMAKHHVARLQVNDHIAEAVSGRSKDWIKMKNPAAREMVVKKDNPSAHDSQPPWPYLRWRGQTILRVSTVAAIAQIAPPWNTARQAGLR
jgi:hypothetical protein